MKKLLPLGLLLAGLTACSKGPAPQKPEFMTAQVNGVAWQPDEAVGPMTNITDDQATSNPIRYSFAVTGESKVGLPGLPGVNVARFIIIISTTYLPKLGRHPINSSAGSLNPKGHYCQAIVYFYLNSPLNYGYNAPVTSGFLNVTEVSDTSIGGTFELSAPVTRAEALAEGAPTVFTITNGAFYSDFGGVYSARTGQPDRVHLNWDGEQ
jgi:hypothetical protein